MSEIIEQVREGLEIKVNGIKNALNFIHDPREIERLQADLNGAIQALDKLNETDTRTPEELKKIAGMIKDTAYIEAPNNTWSQLTPIEKFKYHIDLFVNKISNAYESATAQYEDLRKVCDFLKSVDFKKHPYVEPIYKQFKNSLIELNYSVNSLRSQLSKKDKAIGEIDKAFDSLDIINQFLNNPMSLPHLIEKRDSELEVLENEKSEI